MHQKATITCFDVVISNGDCAEEIDGIALESLEPGMVVSLNTEGVLVACSQKYDKKVAGVISGAGGYQPGIVLGRNGTSAGRFPVALIGKVSCMVDADYAPVEIRDLLTTSATPGHAMKAQDPFLAFGAVIGKALQRLAFGRGMIPVLIALK